MWILQFVVLVLGSICLCRFGGCKYFCYVILLEFRSTNKVWCVRCVCGVSSLVCCGWFASWFDISLPEIPVCAPTFCIVILCLVRRIWWTMAKQVVCWDGCVGVRGGRL